MADQFFLVAAPLLPVLFGVIHGLSIWSTLDGSGRRRLVRHAAGFSAAMLALTLLLVFLHGIIQLPGLLLLFLSAILLVLVARFLFR
ncbi:MAG: hypothetical protein A2087_07390 [Spirochaetes bacterium GWD1_61_31]|nr:MAG: hypothetical protein A2Y37_08085 [Spirochaetes bacterium GWB1_60_80]OHD34235.1 MAG: hypothetical protein A2004_12660 [Spirochaetes bacterium GWC1_61_12]OHD40163.1 MAG: hypothetical protein A2087_07390 [Spirochaetes bacterium GWD1_61_31]OHD45789.1 MAG: hypothetical protein A2Y35_03720 [Spirochaetes bacterium GWE1_60_18]OHD58332.1 MAG: hypothetical protein A2Y32_06110 [Spirochaetes bacterium GWF1_60_12]HAW86329.1 hypothetical protein [Spirochaetaceae bacterium]